MRCALLAWFALTLWPAGGMAAPAALYGERTAPLADFAPRTTPSALPAEIERFAVVRTELFPGVLARVPGGAVRLFAGMKAWGLGAPSFCAVPGRKGVRLLHPGDSVAGGDQAAAWLLAWFAGAEGWSEWDAPVLVVLQHRPRRILLGEDGLLLEFAERGGDLVVLPLYGYYKPPQRSREYLEAHGLPSRGIRTWEWSAGLPDAVLKRCAFFAEVSRAFPVHARESFALEGDSLILRTEMRWHAIADDWRTPARKLAPLSPVLALAWWSGEHRHAAKRFPMALSHPVRDPQVFTPYGPWLGVEGRDAYEVRFPLLSYVHEMEMPQSPGEDARPEVRAALAWVRRRLGEKFRTTDWQQIWDHGGPDNYCWQVMGDRWYAKALPYLPAETRARVARSLQGYMNEFVLQEGKYKPFRDMLLLVGPGIGTWGGYDDAGKFSSNLLETLWCYAHETGDWETIARHWPLIRKLFITPLESDWKSFGRMAIAELGDEAAPPLSLARLAYRVGDGDTYAYACYVFVRELVHHYVKQVGAPYFRLHQPWHSPEFMPEEVYLTNLWGDAAGWQIDGPVYPEKTGERQYNNRWMRFSSEDVARFYRDVLPGEIRAEMDRLTDRAGRRETPYRLDQDAAHIASSMVRLRSLLLNEPPEKLAVLAPPEKWRPGRSADGTAFCLSFLRTSGPTRLQRLIPPRPRTAFVLGLERAVTSDPTLALAVATSVKRRDAAAPAQFPVLRWWGWRPPKRAEGLPGGEWWSFGQVALPGQAPREVRSERLSWNTSVSLYETGPAP